MTDREIDAAVAAAMGWTELRPMPAYTIGGITNLYGTKDGKRLQDVPHYSTDIAAAFLVLEKLRQGGHTFSVGWNGQTWDASIDPEVDDLDRWFPAATPPMAICLAVLAAVDVEVSTT